VPKETAATVKRALARLGDPVRAANLAWFFKTGPGEYGEHDRFIGIRVPELRRAALRFIDLPPEEISELLASDIHEHRLAALEILVAQYEHGGPAEQRRIYQSYLKHTAHINNWDLVDASAPDIVGGYLLRRSRRPLQRLARSNNIWERRIAIVATFAFIRDGETDTTFEIAAKLLGDEHPLIHKAVGWALREAGKTSQPALLAFLKTHYPALPRTTLRYAIERFSPEERTRMLRGQFT
jgi:3-methyladenine DNA glycosylase AlkD